MPRAPVAAKTRKRAPPARKAGGEVVQARPASKVVAVPVPAEPVEAAKPRIEEPVWLVRLVLLLFLVGFAAFLAREVYNFVQALG